MNASFLILSSSLFAVSYVVYNLLNKALADEQREFCYQKLVVSLLVLMRTTRIAEDQVQSLSFPFGIFDR
jgi:hypothetical protein